MLQHSQNELEQGSILRIKSNSINSISFFVNSKNISFLFELKYFLPWPILVNKQLGRSSSYINIIEITMSSSVRSTKILIFHNQGPRSKIEVNYKKGCGKICLPPTIAISIPVSISISVSVIITPSFPVKQNKITSFVKSRYFYTIH